MIGNYNEGLMIYYFLKINYVEHINFENVWVIDFPNTAYRWKKNSPRTNDPNEEY